MMPNNIYPIVHDALEEKIAKILADNIYYCGNDGFIIHGAIAKIKELVLENKFEHTPLTEEDVICPPMKTKIIFLS